MSEYILNTKQLTKKFKNSIVLNHINLDDFSHFDLYVTGTIIG